MNTQFFKTIRFRLTLWYSLLLLFVSFFFVLSINIIITNHYENRPSDLPHTPPMKMMPNGVTEIPRRWQDLNDEYKQLVQEYREQDLQKVRQISFLSFIPLIGLSFFGGYLIAGLMLQPLRKLNKSMQDITAEDLKQKIEHEDTGDEISELINNFNAMTTRLNTSFESQKQFVENASHELKTPLAIIQANLDSAIADKTISKAELLEIIQVATRSSRFMNKLIEDLLLLSIVENAVEKTQVDLITILKASIADLRTLADEKSITIESHFLSKLYIIQGNDVLLQRAFMNIIENAIKYSPEKSIITISTILKKEKIHIEITDQGDGIPEEHMDKIFDRFYRVDKSRSKKTGGSGLGLAIGKKIIELHGGSVVMHSKPKQGSTIRIRFS